MRALLRFTILGLMIPLVAAAAPAIMGKVRSRSVSVTTTPKTVTDLIRASYSGTDAGPIPDWGTMVWNNSATVVCVGDNAVNTSTHADGGSCWPICTTAATCRPFYSAAAGPSAISLRIPGDGGVFQEVIVHVGGLP